MKEIGITLVLLAILVGGLIYFSRDDVEQEENGQDEEIEAVLNEQEAPVSAEAPSAEFIDCLVEAGMVVYASKTCPACTDLANNFGGYDAVEELFVDCNEEPEICQEYAKTGYVPEIQFNGEVFDGGRTMEAFADLTGCEL